MQTLSFIPIVLLALSSSSIRLPGAVIVDLDATIRPAGALASWPNAGSLGGTFEKGLDTPSVIQINRVGGGKINVVSLDGVNDWYVGPDAISGVTGNLSRSVEVWVANSAVGVEESLISWSRRGGADNTNFSFNFGTSTTAGALSLTGVNDTAWGTSSVPSVNLWHHLVVTYNSSQLIVYSDGVQKVLKTISGGLSTSTTYSGGTNAKILIGAQALLDGSVPVQAKATATVSAGAVADVTISANSGGQVILLRRSSPWLAPRAARQRRSPPL